jgi:hypothetical protein
MSINQPILTADQITEITNYVNNYRAANQAPPLAWNAAIATFAQQWSYHLVSNNLFQHSSTQLYGENLAMFQGYGTDVMALLKKSVDNWYNEITLYDFNNPGFSTDTGHFTCLVWKASTDFGMGLSINTTTNLVDITMNTSPPGNVRGEFKQNVLPKNGTAPLPVPLPTPTPVPVPVPLPTPTPVPVPIPLPTPEPLPTPPTTNSTHKINIINSLTNIISEIKALRTKYNIYRSVYSVIHLTNTAIIANYSNSTLTSQLYNVIHQLYNLSNLLRKNTSYSMLILNLQNIIKNVNAIQF